MQPFELTKCITLSGESVKCVSFLFDDIDLSKVLVYIGSSKGTLTAYHIKKAATASTNKRNDYDAEELCSEVIQRKRPIRQIQAVGGSVQGVVVLCDGKVSLHHLRSLGSLQYFDRHRQATLFCVNKTSGDLRYLCVAENRKITLYSYSKKYAIIREIMIDEVAVSLEWLKQSLVVGFRREYRLIDVHSEAPTLVPVPLDETMQPLIKLLPEREMLVCTRSHDNHLAMPLNFNADPCPRPPLVWNSPPLQIAYCFPYVVALTTQRRIEIHNYVNLKCTHSIQTLNLPQGVGIVDCATLAEGLTPHDFKLVLVASPTSIMQVKPKPFPAQVEELLIEEKVEEAYTLVQKTAIGSDQESMIKSFHIKAGILCFKQLEFESAFQRYWSNAGLDPREFVALFPDFDVHVDQDLEPYTPKHLKLEDIVSNSLANVQKVDNESVIVLLIRERKSKETDNEPMRKLRAATECLLLLLMALRTKAKGAHQMPEDALVVLHTAIVKAMLFLDAGQFGKWYTRAVDIVTAADNKCSIPDLTNFLTTQNMHLLLAKLLFRRGRSKQAIQLLEKLGRKEIVEVDHGTGDANGIAEIVEYLCDDEYEKSQDVIFRACEHILAIDPFKVLPVLKKVRDPPLDSQRILTMLADYNDVRVFFLEHMVSSKVYHANRPEEFRELTTRLASEYVQQMIDADQHATPTQRRQKRRETVTQQGTEYAQGINFLKTNQDYNAEEVYGKSRDILENKSLPSGSLLQDVRVQLLGKLGRHQEALNILIYVMNDANKAEDYCVHNQVRQDPSAAIAAKKAARFGRRSSKRVTNPFIVLLQIMFGEKDPSKKQIFKRRALRILNTYTNASSAASGGESYINPMEALAVLPGDLGIKDLETYLKNTIRQTTTELRNSSVKVNILRFKNLKTNVQLHELQSRKVIVYPSSRCPQCKDSIYADQVISVFPNDDIYHLACSPSQKQIQQKSANSGNPFGR